MDRPGLCLLLLPLLAATTAPTRAATPAPVRASTTPAPALAPSPAPGASQDCAAIDEAGVAALFDQWNVALASLDPDTVARRYWDDAVLLPAGSSLARTSPSMVRDHLARFLEQHPRGRIQARIVQLGCNLAIDMGTYVLSTMDAGGAPGETAQRYTYVYAWRGGEWKILHHHASAVAESPATPPSATPAAAAAAASGAGEGDAGRAGTPASAADARTRGPKPLAAPPTVDSTRMFLNAEASPPVMEFYPEEARSRREAGRVAMRVCADPEGRLVGEPKVLKSSGHDRLDAAARQWARAARWVPATSNRRSVEGCTEVTAQFRP
ncbi:MAG: SgcJ/EcaC family oxidoreductase [Steroidobacteraceae bacterium]|jgi:uncharacterized protein (TIGR02246 family)|nr:SgcJ/EcaC family oxidoreductase [Steroidobacteraceae bacterium]